MYRTVVLKMATRAKPGEGIQKIIQENSITPINYRGF